MSSTNTNTPFPLRITPTSRPPTPAFNRTQRYREGNYSIPESTLRGFAPHMHSCRLCGVQSPLLDRHHEEKDDEGKQDRCEHTEGDGKSKLGPWKMLGIQLVCNGICIGLLIVLAIRFTRYLERRSRYIEEWGF